MDPQNDLERETRFEQETCPQDLREQDALTRDEWDRDTAIPADLHTFQRRESWLDRALRLGYLEDEHPRSEPGGLGCWENLGWPKYVSISARNFLIWKMPIPAKRELCNRCR